jgi:hypothetical protein
MDNLEIRQRNLPTERYNAHAIANTNGRDFVMFVTMDAFRPSVATPAEFFSKAGTTKNVAKTRASSKDPMIQLLIHIFDEVH